MRFAFLCATLGLQASCTGASHVPQLAGTEVEVNGGAVSGKLTLAVEVTSFWPQAVHDDFIGGASASYDLTILTITEPGAHQGAQLQVMHVAGSPAGSKRASVGDRCVVTIDAWVLNDAYMLIPGQSLGMNCAK